MARKDADQVAAPARLDGEEAAVRVAVLGCGNVGGALVATLLSDSDAIAQRSGVRLELVGVAVGDPARPRPGVPAALITGDAKGLVSDPRVDVVVELIGGVDPARGLVESALAAGKPVVTANKELLAAHGSALAEAAASVGLDLLYEAAVAGAIPLIRPLRESLAAEPIRRVMGIVNGTTNYILTTMSEEGSPTPRPWPKPNAWGSPSAIPARMSTGTTPRPRPPSSPRWRSTVTWSPTTSRVKASPPWPPSTSPSRRVWATS